MLGFRKRYVFSRFANKIEYSYAVKNREKQGAVTDINTIAKRASAQHATLRTVRLGIAETKHED